MADRFNNALVVGGGNNYQQGDTMTPEQKQQMLLQMQKLMAQKTPIDPRVADLAAHAEGPNPVAPSVDPEVIKAVLAAKGGSAQPDVDNAAFMMKLRNVLNTAKDAPSADQVLSNPSLFNPKPTDSDDDEEEALAKNKKANTYKATEN